MSGAGMVMGEQHHPVAGPLRATDHHQAAGCWLPIDLPIFSSPISLWLLTVFVLHLLCKRFFHDGCLALSSWLLPPHCLVGLDCLLDLATLYIRYRFDEHSHHNAGPVLGALHRPALDSAENKKNKERTNNKTSHQYPANNPSP